MENRENKKRTNRQNGNQIKLHFMIFQWAQASGKDHKQIQGKSATNISRCPTVNMIPHQFSSQTKETKEEEPAVKMHE